MQRFNSRYINTKLHGLSEAVNVRLTGRWILLCAIVGVGAGFGSLLFAFLLQHLQSFALGHLAGYTYPLPAGEADGAVSTIKHTIDEIKYVAHPWMLILLPAVGGLISGALVYTFAPEAEGEGVDNAIKAYHMNRGVIKPLATIIKMIASVITIGSGGSAGREGPIATIGGGVGSFLAMKLNLSEDERKTLVLAGIGAGIGSIFRAPLGGAIFATEVLYRKDIETEGLIPSIIASIIAYSIYSSVTGWKTVFIFQAAHFERPLELPLYIVLALIVTVVGIFYTRIFFALKHNFFDRLKINKYWKPAIGGLMVGAVAYFFPAVLSSSYGYLQLALQGNLTIPFMLILAFLKIFTTSFTIQSGGSGGVFAPSLVIGGLLGGAYGLLVHQLFPTLAVDPQGYALVGMGAFFSGVVNIPFAATILITEMSGSYDLLVPLIFASAISYIGAQSWSLYAQQLESRLGSMSHRGAFMREVLESVKVRTAYRPVPNMPVIEIDTPIQKILDAFTRSEVLVLPVLNKSTDKLVGLLSIYDVRNLLNNEDSPAIIAADIMTPLFVLHLNDSLGKAFEYFIESGEPEIPVLANGSDRRAIGTLSERGFLIAYEKSVKASGATSEIYE